MRILVFLSALIVFPALAQDSWTLDAVLSRVLQEDFGIRIARNKSEQATTANNPGAAGYLPQIGLAAEQSWVINSARQEFLSGQVNEADNAQNRAFSAGVMLNWTFFDGFHMFLEDKRLDLLEESAKLNVAAEIEMKIYRTTIGFYTLLVLEEMREMFAESIALSSLRLDQMTTKRRLGAANELEFLQAQMDLVADSAAYRQNARAIELLKTELNGMMARQPDLALNLSGSFPAELKLLNWNAIREKAITQNTSLLQAKAQLAIREKEHKQVLSRYYPQLAFFAGYSVGSSRNQVGFLVSNRSYGPQFGLSLRWDILQGLSRLSESKNARLETENAALFQQQQELAVATELRSAFLDYEWALENLRFELQYMESAQAGSEIMKKSMEIGSVTPLQLREFQFSLVAAQSRLMQAKLEYITALLNLYLGTGDFSELLMTN
jgi:outer membrane protein